MRALRVVGINEDGSVVLEDSGRRERFTVPADEQLRAAARGDLTRLGQIAIELESQLRPREIQARIRAGASVEQVAAAAGVPPQKIERFAYPVLLERSRTVEVAQRAHPMRPDGPDARILIDVIANTFGLRGLEYTEAEWDSWKGEDGKWVVALSWRAGRSDNRAHWTFHPGAHGGTVTALDEHAGDLVEGLSARPLRTVGPVIDLARSEEPGADRTTGGAAGGRLGQRGAQCRRDAGGHRPGPAADGPDRDGATPGRPARPAHRRTTHRRTTHQAHRTTQHRTTHQRPAHRRTASFRATDGRTARCRTADRRAVLGRSTYRRTAGRRAARPRRGLPSAGCRDAGCRDAGCRDAAPDAVPRHAGPRRGLPTSAWPKREPPPGRPRCRPRRPPRRPADPPSRRRPPSRSPNRPARPPRPASPHPPGTGAPRRASR